MKRFLDCSSSEFNWMSGKEFLDSIAASEGRIMLCETFGLSQPMLEDITNAEFVSAMGADLILLNVFDADKPVIKGLPGTKPEAVIRELKRLTGRPIGVNLEPAVLPEENNNPSPYDLTAGRRATPENVQKLHEMGVDFIVLTGNPGNGVHTEAIVTSLKLIRAEYQEKVILAAGKMHEFSSSQKLGNAPVTKEEVKTLIEAGADIILLPAPGTIPGVTMEYVRELVVQAHSLGALTITVIGTSQEGSDTRTIQEIALMCKMTGTDIHHLGGSGFAGMPSPDNILAYSIAIRGVRHTYHRMASSIRR